MSKPGEVIREDEGQVHLRGKKRTRLCQSNYKLVLSAAICSKHQDLTFILNHVVVARFLSFGVSSSHFKYYDLTLHCIFTFVFKSSLQLCLYDTMFPQRQHLLHGQEMNLDFRRHTLVYLPTM